MLLGYGSVETWPVLNPTVAAADLAKAGLTLTEIEWTIGQSSTTYPREAKAWVIAMRARGVTTLINIVNWNNAAARLQDDAWFQTQLSTVLAFGPGGLILKGVSEANGDATALRWQQKVVTQASGWATGGNVSHRSAVGGETWPTYHSCSVAALLGLLNPSRIVISDCTPVLASNLSQADVQDLTRNALDRRSPLLLYDTFQVGWNSRVVGWMGDEVQR
mgnify:FL=1